MGKEGGERKFRGGEIVQEEEKRNNTQEESKDKTKRSLEKTKKKITNKKTEKLCKMDFDTKSDENTKSF